MSLQSMHIAFHLVRIIKLRFANILHGLLVGHTIDPSRPTDTHLKRHVLNFPLKKEMLINKPIGYVGLKESDWSPSGLFTFYRYNLAIKVCSLKPDLELLPYGDMTEVSVIVQSCFNSDFPGPAMERNCSFCYPTSVLYHSFSLWNTYLYS